MSKLRTVIFVCTGNTCRSPMAEVLAIKAFRDFSLECDVVSRGINVMFPERANDKAQNVLRLDYGIEMKNHISKGLSGEDMEDTSLILTMTESQKRFIGAAYPYCGARVFTIREVVGQTGDIKDPFGMDIFAYRKCAGEIKFCVDRLAVKLSNKEIVI